MEITLDADFAAIAEAGDYLVFLTPKGDTMGLTVAAQGPSGFAVREIGGGMGSGGYYWRAMARPEGDGKAQRLAKYAQPQIRIPGLAELAKPPPVPPPKDIAPPTPPELAPQSAPPPRTTSQPGAMTAPAPAAMAPTIPPTAAPIVPTSQAAPPSR